MPGWGGERSCVVRGWMSRARRSRRRRSGLWRVREGCEASVGTVSECSSGGGGARTPSMSIRSTCPPTCPCGPTDAPCWCRRIVAKVKKTSAEPEGFGSLGSFGDLLGVPLLSEAVDSPPSARSVSDRGAGHRRCPVPFILRKLREVDADLAAGMNGGPPTPRPPPPGPTCSWAPSFRAR
jgi:hypothetical protein